MLSLARLGIQVIAVIALCLGFFVIWCGLLVSDNTVRESLESVGKSGCADARLIAEARVGATTNRTILIVLSKQITAYRLKNARTPSYARHYHGAATMLGLATFWSRDHRQNLFNAFLPKMRPCKVRKLGATAAHEVG